MAPRDVRSSTHAARVAALPTAASDAELVARALGGDRWAEEAIYRRHVHKVTTVAARLLRHGPDIEDAVQDAFIEALRDLTKLREPERLGGWLVQIVVHRVHKTFRRRKLLRLIGLERGRDDEPLALQARVDAGQEARVELALLDEALDALSFEERAAWVLVVLEGHSLVEATGLLGCSLATVKRRIARAEHVVRAHLQTEDAAEDAAAKGARQVEVGDV